MSILKADEQKNQLIKNQRDEIIKLKDMLLTHQNSPKNNDQPVNNQEWSKFEWDYRLSDITLTEEFEFSIDKIQIENEIGAIK